MAVIISISLDLFVYFFFFFLITCFESQLFSSCVDMVSMLFQDRDCSRHTSGPYIS